MRERTSSHLTSRSAALPLATVLTLVALPASAGTVTGGILIISEYRVRGPNGANDEFIEIYNNSGADHTVASISGSGYGIAASDGVVRCTIPNGTVIPANGHFLCANSLGYSLSGYPAGNGTTATGDFTHTTDIPDQSGIALFNNNTGGGSFTLANRFDAVGPTAEANTLYREGAGVPSLTPFSIDYAWVRDECGKGGAVNLLGPCTISTPKDTDNNAVDFYFVDTNGTSAGGGQRLGAGGPQNLSSPVSGGAISAAPLDATVIDHPPNSVRDFTSDPANNSTFGTISIRRRFTNTSGAAVTRLRFRIVDIDTFPAASGFADLRPRTSTDVMVAGINDSATCASLGAPATPPCTVAVRGTPLEQPPPQPNGGGFGSSMGAGTVTLATPLAAGASVAVQFLFGIQQTGSFRVGILIEGLPAGGGLFMVPIGSGDEFYSVTPCRVVDTRNPNGPLGGPALVANTTRTFDPRNTCVIPLTALSIAANVAVVSPSSGGYLTVYPAGHPLPPVSTINVNPGVTRANNGIFELGPSGVSVNCHLVSGTAHFVLDVTGYFLASTGGQTGRGQTDALSPP
jgi:hypothetical protein